MFAKTVIDSDVFIDMPATARLLYYDLSMRADDDGFVNSPKKIIRMTGASEDDLRVLIARQFVIPFESGVVVIKHWKIHNYIRKDRYQETACVTEKSLLSTEKTGEYNLMDTIGQPSDNQRLTQDRLGKDRIDKDSINNIGCPHPVDEPSTQIKNGNTEGADAPVFEKPKKKPKEKKIYYPLDEKLNQAVLDFIAFRKTIKAPMTDRAVELMIGSLDEMTANNNEKIKILEQSIVNGWKGIFPLQSSSNQYGKGGDINGSAGTAVGSSNKYAKYNGVEL